MYTGCNEISRHPSIRNHRLPILVNVVQEVQKNQKFWKTIKPFLTSKQPTNNNIILKEDDKIITDEREICDIFNDYFSPVAMDIGFKDDIPDDFLTADGFARLIDKHCNHPSIIKIREHIQTQRYFYFTTVNDKHIEKNMQKNGP